MSSADPYSTQTYSAAPAPRHDRAPGASPREPWQSRWSQADQNVAGNERLVSLASGAVLTLLGARRRDFTGLLVAGVGVAMIYRGVTGHCPVYESLGVDTAHEGRTAVGAARHTKKGKRNVHVARSVLIDKSPEELYAHWRNFENLPRIMTHLESVRVLDERRSHWTAKAPNIAGGRVEWDAEITADEPNARIAWRSLPGADIENQGEVRFVRAPGDRGTAVRVVVDYAPPGGRLGKWAARLFGEEPEQQIWRDLHNFKAMMEVGEIPSVEGQPRGACFGRGSQDGR